VPEYAYRQICHYKMSFATLSLSRSAAVAVAEVVAAVAAVAVLAGNLRHPAAERKLCSQPLQAQTSLTLSCVSSDVMYSLYFPRSNCPEEKITQNNPA
jgi:hypothetical protein